MMAYQFLQSESIQEGVCRIVCEQIDSSLGELEVTAVDRHEVVHRVRKSCKKIRGLLRLVREAMAEVYPQENQSFRASAKLLSELRDAHVLINTATKLQEQYPQQLSAEAGQQLFMLLCARKDRVIQTVNMEARLNEFRSQFEAARQRVEDWQFSQDNFKALEPGLREIYSRGYRAMKLAYKDAQENESFHEWRKWVKYHWYHVRLLSNLWPTVVSVFEQQLDQLGDLLGLEHDLLVLAEVISEEPELAQNLLHRDHILDFIQQRRKELQQQARPLGQLLFAEKPKALTKRYRRYWKIWKPESPKTTSPLTM